MKNIENEKIKAHSCLLAAIYVTVMLTIWTMLPDVAYAAPKGQTQQKAALRSSNWNKTFTTFTNYPVSVIAASDGGSLVIGSKGESAKATGLALWVMKSDQRGNKVWEKTFSPVKNSQNNGYAAFETRDGYLVTGRKDSSDYQRGGALQVELWVLKMAKNGATLWEKAYGCRWGDISSGEGRSIIQTDDGGILVAGFGSVGGAQEAWLLGLDKNGNKQWEKFLGPADSSVAPVSLVQTTAGKIFAAFTSPSERIIVAKLDSGGAIVWRRQIDQYQRSNLGSLRATRDGGFILAGGANGQGLLMKFNSDGSPDWRRTFNTKGISAKLYAVAETADDRLIAVGGISEGKARLWILQTDQQGTVIKDQDISDKRLATGYAVAQTSDGGFNMAGLNDTGNAIWLMKLDQTGVLLGN